MADLDIEETNRLRAALGMAPIPTSSNTNDLQFKTGGKGDDEDSDPGSTLDTRQAAAGDNWKKLQDEADNKKRREARLAKLKKERDAAQRFRKLEGKGLGDADDDVDTRSWLLAGQKRQKKIEKQRARMLQQELEMRENMAQYTEKDLKGAKIAHELGAFDEEGEHILTIKDAEIGDESEDDELENVDLRDKEKADERNKLKLKKPDYDPNAEENEGGQSLLGKYDEEISGKKKKHFTLDGMGRTEEERARAAEGKAGPQGMQFNLDLDFDDKPTSDYVDISEIKVKKPKKSKKDKTKRKRDTDADDIFPVENSAAPDAMDIELPSSNGTSKRKLEDTSFADDDDLQASLANQRSAALKKRKRAGPEELARQLREEASAAPDDMNTDEDGGLTIDETSEFLTKLQKPQAREATREASTKPIKREGSASASPGDNDASMDSGDEEEKPKFKPEPSPGAPGPHTATGLSDEKDFTSVGLGNVFGMLNERGNLKSGDGSNANVAHSQQAKFLAEKVRLQREYDAENAIRRKRDRDAGLFDGMSIQKREEMAQQDNRQRDITVSRRLNELINKEYKPTVQLKYHDENGRSLGQKEAFKQLSHQFHGKGSGKQKTEKHLKKIEEEKAREARSNLDASAASGMGRAGQTQARKQKQAGVRLQ